MLKQLTACFCASEEMMVKFVTSCSSGTEISHNSVNISTSGGFAACTHSMRDSSAHIRSRNRLRLSSDAGVEAKALRRPLPSRFPNSSYVALSLLQILLTELNSLSFKELPAASRMHSVSSDTYLDASTPSMSFMTASTSTSPLKSFNLFWNRVTRAMLLSLFPVICEPEAFAARLSLRSSTRANSSRSSSAYFCLASSANFAFGSSAFSAALLASLLSALVSTFGSGFEDLPSF
mmetsp:Transcript_919/g.2151  ORF Transcript_919/g.2151 Transcript_919/m.2151 type:complete len:235 (+) Transcript_919:3079-3783(+)